MTDADGTASLRTRVVSGFAWGAGAAGAVQVSRLVFGVVLARLLTPHEYGLAGMALVFAALVLNVSDLGLGAGLVQRAKITEADRSTVFWTSLALGGVLAGAGLALSGPVASFYGEPDVRPLFAAVSIAFLVTALGRTHAALYQRDMAFRAISVRVMAATLTAGVVAVVLAALDYGPWALIGMHIANGVVTTLLLWTLSPWRPRFMYSLTSLRKLGGFGLNVFGSKIAEYLHVSSDKILVGRFLGSSALGFYNIGYNLVVLPFASLIAALLDALFPAMSRVQGDRARVAAAWMRASRTLFAIGAPAMLGLVIVAPDFVTVLLGARWRPAIPVVQVLAIAMLVHSATALGTMVLTSVDRTATLLRFSIAEVIVIIIGLAVGLRWGIAGVAAGYLSAITVTRSVLVLLTARTLAVSVRAVGRNFAGVLQAALAMTAVAWLARFALLEVDAPAFVRLVAVVITAAVIYLPLSMWRSPDVVRDLRALRRGGAAA